MLQTSDDDSGSVGRFFVLEGADAHLISLQLGKLAQKIANEGHTVMVFDFPQIDSDSSFFVREFNADHFGDHDLIGPYTGSLFYALDRFAARSAIIESLKKGHIVLASHFTGQTMAEQGVKFRHPEERRGYFIWLDNLEYQILGLPRPAMSIVLKSPTNDGSASKGKTDNDQPRVAQKLTDTFDDLCALFPKDFQRIDCSRDSQQLSNQQIQNLIWGMISVQLPVPRKTSGNILRAHSSQSDHEDRPIQFKKPNQKNNDGRYEYFTPSTLTAEVKQQYQEIMDRIYDSYGQLTVKLTAYLKKQPQSVASAHSSLSQAPEDQAYEIVRGTLPVAGDITAMFFAALHTNQDTATVFNKNYNALVSTQRKVSEAQINAAAEVLSSQKNKDIKSTNKLHDLADKMLPSTHMPAVKTVDLISVAPQNELDLAADMLYEHSNLSWHEIKNAAHTWTYDEKEQIIASYLNEHKASNYQFAKVLEKVRYTWELTCEFNVFHDIVSHCKIESVICQNLTPRYGYETPQEIIDADLAEQYDVCFDLSLKLYGLLVSNDYEQEAQYAILCGHKIRWQFSHTALEIRAIKDAINRHTNTDSQKLLANEIQDKIAERHSLLSSFIQ